ncbi:MAG: hypothetical protein GXW90_05505 [Tepidanaerobacter acetatoxydans]|jgi:hypothetical protein|uniref:DUF7916 family protein n=1 Tax=Tepidanaerobacter TaxID=499228 RepID=UPI000AF70E72|nr:MULTISPECIES: hypothetical protein [Tepidanaerobacter]NLU10388.1 hypothetical protein [Tepidanaerobacter acetatoxydans]
MKRIFELGSKDFMTLGKQEILSTIKNSEGRSVMAEVVVTALPLIYGVSGLEMAAAFGADMITLNLFDFDNPFIFGIDEIDLSNGVNAISMIEQKIRENQKNPDYIRNAKNIIGRFIGVNLEPVPVGINYPEGRKLKAENLIKAKELGFDYILITGNPNTGVTHRAILEGIEEAAELIGDKVIIMAGKMHAAGEENIYDSSICKDFVKAGADVILIPAPGTIPGMDQKMARCQIETIHECQALALTSIGTSQESSSEDTIEQIALMSKMAGADIQHIGDAGYCGMAFPENIMALSIAIRGKRHTYRRMAYSLKR